VLVLVPQPDDVDILELGSDTPDRDMFLSKFDPAGDYMWTRVIASNYHDYGNGAVANGPGSVYVTGAYWDYADFAPTMAPCNEDPDVQYADGDRDAFLSRYLSDGCW